MGNCPDRFFSPSPEHRVVIVNINVTINTRKADRILRLLNQLKEITMTNQEKIDAITAALDAAATGLRADIDALKAQVLAGQTLDFTSLDAKVAALAALDAENPPATP